MAGGKHVLAVSVTLFAPKPLTAGFSSHKLFYYFPSLRYFIYTCMGIERISFVSMKNRARMRIYNALRTADSHLACPLNTNGNWKKDARNEKKWRCTDRQAADLIVVVFTRCKFEQKEMRTNTRR